jgi:hypothetical protein
MLIAGGQIWDVDQTFLMTLTMQDCSSGDLKSWKHYKTNPFEWIVDDFSNQKIQVIGTPKTIGQAKITGSIIEKYQG